MDSDLELENEVQKQNCSLVSRDNVVQNFFVQEYLLGNLSRMEFIAEFDRLEFYERNCLGTLWPWGLWSWLTHCAADHTIHSFAAFQVEVKSQLSISLRLYRGNVISGIERVYKGQAIITRQQYMWARTLAINESLVSANRLTDVLAASKKESEQFVIWLPLPDVLTHIICAYAVDCLAYLRLHLPEKIAIEESLLCLGLHQKWEPLIPDNVLGVPHPTRKKRMHKMLSTHYALNIEKSEHER